MCLLRASVQDCFSKGGLEMCRLRTPMELVGLTDSQVPSQVYWIRISFEQGPQVAQHEKWRCARAEWCYTLMCVQWSRAVGASPVPVVQM